jgi:hypothetical protein
MLVSPALFVKEIAKKPFPERARSYVFSVVLREP